MMGSHFECISVHRLFKWKGNICFLHPASIHFENEHVKSPPIILF